MRSILILLAVLLVPTVLMAQLNEHSPILIGTQVFVIEAFISLPALKRD